MDWADHIRDMMREVLFQQVCESIDRLERMQRDLGVDLAADEDAEHEPILRTKMNRRAMKGAVLHECVEHDGIFYVMGRNESDIPGCYMGRSFV